MNTEIKIRKEEPKDIPAVREIVRAAFPTEVESQLVDALRENGRAVVSLVVVNAEKVVGHILFSPVTTAPPSDARGIGLAPVAVRPDLQSQGIGSKLIREGLRLCREMVFDYCVVLGSPGYYQRFGFQKASPFGIRNEYGVEEEFMIIRLSDRGVAGRVQYASEFALFSV